MENVWPPGAYRIFFQFIMAFLHLVGCKDAMGVRCLPCMFGSGHNMHFFLKKKKTGRIFFGESFLCLFFSYFFRVIFPCGPDYRRKRGGVGCLDIQKLIFDDSSSFTVYFRVLNKGESIFSTGMYGDRSELQVDDRANFSVTI